MSVFDAEYEPINNNIQLIKDFAEETGFKIVITTVGNQTEQENC